jgi:hypothetical protein
MPRREDAIVANPPCWTSAVSHAGLDSTASNLSRTDGGTARSSATANCAKEIKIALLVMGHWVSGICKASRQNWPHRAAGLKGPGHG